MKFGASVSASYAWIVANTSFDYGTTQQTAREDTHKRMRQQTEKLSTEIRHNYKSTFKTVTETTDTSSKRYVLANTTDELVNYELRRKMRQVGVQVQDIGSYLCWQTYVDGPGEALGVAKLMHIAKPAELDSLHAAGGDPHAAAVRRDQGGDLAVRVASTTPTPTTRARSTRTAIEVDDSEWFGNLENDPVGLPDRVRLRARQLRADERRVRRPGQAGHGQPPQRRHRQR